MTSTGKTRPPSRHSLHKAVELAPEHRAVIRSAAAQLSAFALAPEAAGATATNEIPLTTVSADSSFDAYINVCFPGAPAGSSLPLLVDSGNTTLIVPRWEDIQSIPGYQVLGQATEPWGCPANVVADRFN